MDKRFAILNENNILSFSCSEYELEEILEKHVGVNPLCLLCYNHPDSICKNIPDNYHNIFSEELSAFISPNPNPTYILNLDNFEWEPNPELEYDLHGDGKLYTYIPDRGNGLGPGWKPVFNEIKET